MCRECSRSSGCHRRVGKEDSMRRMSLPVPVLGCCKRGETAPSTMQGRPIHVRCHGARSHKKPRGGTYSPAMGAAGVSFWKMTASHSNSSLLTATTCRAPRCGELPIESSNRIASFQILEEPGLGINQATRPRARREKRRAEPADTHPRRPPGGPLNTYSRGRNQSLGRLPSPIGQ